MLPPTIWGGVFFFFFFFFFCPPRPGYPEPVYLDVGGLIHMGVYRTKPIADWFLCRNLDAASVYRAGGEMGHIPEVS